VLQEREVRRVGDNTSVYVNVRVLAATNEPLEKRVKEGQFREDLYYRLNVISIPLPNLHERQDDIPLLVGHFLQNRGPNREGKPYQLTRQAMEALYAHHWPGNVRELENVIQRALVVTKSDAILPNDLPPEILNLQGALDAAASVPPLAPASSNASTAEPVSVPASAGLPELARQLFAWARRDTQLKILPAVERELIIHALAETNGNQVQAARLLGITRATLRKRIEKFNIKQELSIQ
jgi:two-component system nitrogen regulation response regulator GlnG